MPDRLWHHLCCAEAVSAILLVQLPVLTEIAETLMQLPTDYKPRNRNQNTRAPAEAVGKVADIKDVQISRPRRFRWFGRQPEPDLQPYQ